MSTITHSIYPPRDCYMERMDDPEFVSLREWLADLFDTDLTVRGLFSTLSARLSHILSKGDPGVGESVDDIVFAFFTEDCGYCFPSAPSFDWTATQFGATKVLWFELLKERRKRHAHTTIIDDVRLFDIMTGDDFKSVRVWLENHITARVDPDDIVDDLRGQIEMVLNRDDTSVPLTIERIAENFFDFEVYFSFYPYVFGVPVEHTEFGRLRTAWMRYKHSFEP